MMSKCSESRLSELIDLYEKLVFSICYKITGDYFIAEDLTQETFLSVFQKYDTFDGGNEKAWICRIATNKSIDYVRSAGHKGVPTEDDFFEGITEKRGSPEELCMEEEIKRGLKVSCESLKTPYDKTIQTQIYRARDMLRKIYGREGTA